MANLVAKKGCFKTGCLGCLAVAAGLFVLLLLLGLLGNLSQSPRRDERVERGLAITSPTTAPGPLASEEGGATAGAEASHPVGLELPVHTIAGEPLHLELHLAKGRFVIEPGRAGEAVRVEADYDAAHFELDEHYDAAARRYVVRFDSRGGWLGLVGNTDGSHNEVHITIPPDLPLLLEGKVAVGQSRIELGGLAVREVDLDLGVGEHSISFERPLPAPMERLDLSGSVGQLQVDGVGNASPLRVRVSSSIGSLGLDLNGSWLRDSEIDVRCGLGDCHVTTPHDVNVEVERASVAIGEVTRSPRGDSETVRPGAPTLRLRASAKMGEVKVY